MGLKRHPELEGKSATFWHFVTEGKVEADRTPVRERIERIGWPKAIILPFEELDVGSVAKIPWVHGAKAPGEPPSAAYSSLFSIPVPRRIASLPNFCVI